MKITRFELLRAPFVDRDQVCRREAKIMQNDAKMQLKSSQNDHEKTWIPILQWSETHAIDRPMKMHKNIVFFVVPDIALLTPWMQKSLKIVENSPKNNHKKYEARSCNGQQYTPSADLRKCIKTRSFYRSRCCFAHATDWKIDQNRRKSSMGACTVSTVVPAARRANSKCIYRQCPWHWTRTLTAKLLRS